MKKHFIVYLKRFLKISPYVMLLCLVLFASVGAVFFGYKDSVENREESKKLNVGISGDIGDNTFFSALKAVTTLDSFRYSVEIHELSEKEASKKLSSGQLSAYVVFPDGFISSALRGEITPVKFVTRTDDSVLVNMLKKEITRIIEDVLLSSQRGIFAVEELLYDTDNKSILSTHLNEINLKYIKLVLTREGMYDCRELGVSSGVGIMEHFFGGISVLFLFVSVLSYASVLIKKDNSLSLVSSSRGVGALKQTVAEFLALLSNFALIALVIITVFFLLSGLKNEEGFFLRFIPAVILIAALSCAFNMFLFEVSGNIVTGIILQFFTTLFLSYMSGCLYPIFALPEGLQKAAAFIPTGSARCLLEESFSYGLSLESLLFVIGYTVLFVILAALTRRCKMSKL